MIVIMPIQSSVHTTVSDDRIISSKFASDSEANASESLTNLEGMCS